MVGLALIPVVIVAATVGFFRFRARARRKLARSDRPIHVSVRGRDGAADPS